MATDRLRTQLSFLIEIDKVKQIIRQSYIADGSRRENDAEHSWHLAMMTMLLAEHASEKVDVLRVLKMVLIHDIVEIDAGDTYCYDTQAATSQKQRELQAADRIFSMLPTDQSQEMRQIWDEFEARQSPEAKFAAGLDRLQPVLLNYLTQGKAWLAHGIKKQQVIDRNQHIANGSPVLWEYVKDLIDDAVMKGYLNP